MTEATQLDDDISPFSRFIGLEHLEITDKHAITQLQTQPHHLNPIGAIHGGALMALADNSATRMANHANAGGPNDGRFMVGIDAHVTFLGNQPGGLITAEATPVRVGRRITVIRTRVTGDDDRLLIELTTTHIPA
jgi:1,4-dihydroxy-2-naphthoyl-CoA hydrolase